MNALYAVNICLNSLLILYGLATFAQDSGVAIWVGLQGTLFLGILLASETLLQKKKRKSQFLWIHLVMSMLFLLNTYLMVARLYDAHPWIDIPLHFLGGLCIALYVAFYSQPLNLTRNEEWVWIIAITLSMGVVWEWAEYIGSLFITNHRLLAPATDILGDLCMDALGAVLGALIMIRK